MPKRFTATENAIEKGLENTSPKQGAKLVREWLDEVENLDMPGAKGLHGDLQKLATELEKDEADPAKIEKLLGKLGPATVKLADRCDDEKVGDKVRTLGEALIDSGEEGADDHETVGAK
ncbi:MAG: hypothetical protein A4S16_10315 [Proteobacteria bacterium SG_bin6]|nr:MAG: hypothetical protein A4S16_10315 [Proteobacteria bacterium SG_bin6]